MPSVFENLSDQFYTGFFEPDPGKREDAIEAWVKTATPVIQAAVEDDLRRYLLSVLTKDIDTPQGWRARADKFKRIMYGYKLCLDITIRQVNDRKDEVVEPLSPKVRANTLEAANRALPDDPKPPAKVSRLARSPSASAVKADDDYEDDRGGDRSPNDDRSDSMNPNNDAYQASMDNRSDQMNPNNDAYWSSRGR